MDTQARTLKSLEWNRLKSYLAAEASCNSSRELCLELEAQTERSFVELALAETEEASRLLLNMLDLSQPGLPDLTEHIARLTSGAALNAAECLDLRRFLSICRRNKTVLGGLDPAAFPLFQDFQKKIYVLEELRQAIEKVVDEDGGISDDASSSLRHLRADRQRLNGKIKEELLKIINSPTLSKCLQEPIYTQRNGRNVIPVNASQRQSIDGIVHDSSGSGLTVYVEPLVVVELTNKVRLIESEIEREIARLLLELSNKARVHLTPIAESFATLIQVDFIWARALLARKYGGRSVELLQERKLKLLQARHPLLVLQNGSLDAVVPNDLIIGAELRTLVITGPNTGGKTVFLKTAGLLCLMLRAGLLLPVSEGSSAGIFSGIVADIGDEQSLEQNLSTFSSHLGSIIDIVHNAREGSLILLDEIGAGTDPREGVVLARVILAELKRSGALTICSTHYGDLKTLAHSNSGFSNASMDFDEVTLVPTYRLKLGVPGSSRALAIARRLGLPEQLIIEAESLLQSEKKDYEIKIEELESKLSILLSKEELLVEREKQVKSLENSWQEKNNNLKEEIRKFKTEASSNIHEELRTAKKTVAELTANLQKEPSLAKAQEAQKKLEQLKQDLNWLEPVSNASKQLNFEKGQQVRIKSLNQIGVIDDLLQSGASIKQAMIKTGNMRIKANLADLELMQNKATKSNKHIQAPAKHKAKPAYMSQDDPCFVRTTRNTLDLRGKRVDEALAELGRFIDECYLEQLSPLMVIHGHGTGALKSVVRDFLSAGSYQAKFRPGELYEGGDGVTVVQFN